MEYKIQGVSDKALGGIMLITAAVVFVYYTMWALILVRVTTWFGLYNAEYIPAITSS